MDADLVGGGGGAAGERVGVGAGRGLFALGDVAVGLARLAEAVREDGAEDGPHEGDAGTGAADAGLEHGPEESRGNGKGNVGVGEGEEGDEAEDADHADAARGLVPMGDERAGLNSYNNPTPKTPSRITLFLRGICSDQTLGTGRERTIRSVTRFSPPAAM